MTSRKKEGSLSADEKRVVKALLANRLAESGYSGTPECWPHCDNQ